MLFGKTIVVTGVSSGIGSRTAMLVGNLGASVVGMDVRPPSLALDSFVQVDLTNAGQVTAAIDRLPRSVDALCNVAGVSGALGAATALAVNFFGLRSLSEAMVPRLREGAAIVNVASIAGYGWRENLGRARDIVDMHGHPDPDDVVRRFGIVDGYSASKELLILWTMKAARQERYRERQIRVNAVSPGPVETPILGEFRTVLGDQRVDSDIGRVGRSGTTWDIAPAIAFLCSDGARWINGVNLAVDGGLEAAMHAEALGF